MLRLFTNNDAIAFGKHPYIYKKGLTRPLTSTFGAFDPSFDRSNAKHTRKPL
jgi:hypothetical protein